MAYIACFKKNVLYLYHRIDLIYSVLIQKIVLIEIHQKLITHFHYLIICNISTYLYLFRSNTINNIVYNICLDQPNRCIMYSEQCLT